MTFTEGLKGTFDVCEVSFTESEAKVTMYGAIEAEDYLQTAKYTVSDGKASMTEDGVTITTSAIKDDKFTVENEGLFIKFSRTKGTKLRDYKPETPVEPTDPETPVENLFAGKTFYGTVDGYPYDVCKLDFTSDSEVTLTLYGQGEAGADLVENLTYTVSDGIAIVDYKGQKIPHLKQV